MKTRKKEKMKENFLEIMLLLLFEILLKQILEW